MYFLIGADIVPTETNSELFRIGNVNELVGNELVRLLNSSNYNIFNLEVPLVDEVNPIDKCGPNLIAPTNCITGYKNMNIHALSLANNHILDQGEKGLDSTCKILQENNIKYFGVGNNQKEASTPFLFDFNGKMVGIYSCAEHEFSIVSNNTKGANPFDPLESFDHVADLKNKCDYLIVLYHGGKEHYRYPSPMLRKVFRKFADKGADLVIAQHTHCIGCKEEYSGSTLVYGQGNFLFDRRHNECWDTSLLLQINDDFTVSYIPLVKEDNVVRKAQDIDAEAILFDFNTRSNEILKDGFIEKKYTEFSKNSINSYLTKLQGKETFLFKVINKLSRNKLRKRTLNRKYDKKTLLAIKNSIECEAHSELLIKGLEGDLSE